MRHSKYWDDFSRRIEETVNAVKGDYNPIVRRVACFVTDRCNFRCEYCNSDHNGAVMDKITFRRQHTLSMEAQDEAVKEETSQSTLYEIDLMALSSLIVKILV